MEQQGFECINADFFSQTIALAGLLGGFAMRAALEHIRLGADTEKPHAGTHTTLGLIFSISAASLVTAATLSMAAAIAVGYASVSGAVPRGLSTRLAIVAWVIRPAVVGGIAAFMAGIAEAARGFLGPTGRAIRIVLLLSAIIIAVLGAVILW